jgi:2-C-methyl-D-erythritol 4-phosphate cytidylyltransferase
MYTAIILAAGSGNRSGLTINKVLHPICGKPVIDYSIDFFLSDKRCEEIIVVGRNEEKEFFTSRNLVFITGGSTRQESVLNGLQRVNSKYVAIHDGARPIHNGRVFSQLIDAVKTNACVIPVVPILESLISLNNNVVDHYLDRSIFYTVQTPQLFETKLILKAHLLAQRESRQFTDDGSLFKHYLDQEVLVVVGDNNNIKLTTENDIKRLESILCSE